MMRKTMLVGVLLLAAAPLALAQPAPRGGPDDGPRAEDRDRDRDRDEDRDRDRDEDRDRDRDRDRDEDRDRDRDEDRRDRDRDRDEREARGERHGAHDREHAERRGPPHGPGGHGREAGASFRLILGPAGSLTVRCGEEALRPCVEAARPLIEAMADGAREPRPAPGLAPLPPAEDELLDVPLPDDVSADEPPALPEALAGEGEPAPAN